MNSLNNRPLVNNKSTPVIFTARRPSHNQNENLLLVILLTLLALTLAPPASAASHLRQCQETLSYRTPQKSTLPSSINPIRGFESSSEARIKPLLTQALAEFPTKPKVSVEILNGLFMHNSLSRFSWIYIRTIETLIRDSIFWEKQDRSHKGIYSAPVKELLELLAKLERQYKTNENVFSSPESTQTVPTQNSAQSVIFRNLMVSIDTMLGASPEQFTKTLRHIDRQLLATAEHEAALKILRHIGVNQVFAHYLLVQGNNLTKLLFSTDIKQASALAVIEKISHSEPEFVVEAIGKILSLPWTGQETFFTALITTLHNSVNYNKKVQLEPSTLQEINARMEYELNAPIRDSELYMLNLFDRHLEHDQLAQSSGWAKLVAIIKTLVRRPIALSNKNETILLDRLASKVVTGKISAEIESQVLATLMEERANFISQYETIKANQKAQRQKISKAAGVSGSTTPSSTSSASTPSSSEKASDVDANIEDEDEDDNITLF